MADKPQPKPAPPAKRGGLGRGLGALIPSAPLTNAGGKGHFWSALDNPPVVDDDVKKQVADDAAARKAVAAEADRPVEADRPIEADRTIDAAVSITTPAFPTTSEEQADDAPAVVDDSMTDVSRETRSPSSAELPTAATVTASPVASSETDAEATAATSTRDVIQRPADHAVSSDVSRETGATDPSEIAADDAVAVLVELSPDEIRANPKNPRTVFDDDELSELSESIKEFGLLQPIVVRETAEGYELIMGERRLRASRQAGIERIPVIVRHTEDDAMLRDALLENIHRVQLHPLEEAAAYQQLIDEFGVTHEELAIRIKRSRPAISNTIRLLKLPTKVQNRVAAGIISGSHARALLSLEDSAAQEALATRIVAEGLSVRATEEAVALHESGDDVRPSRARRKPVTAPALRSLAEKLSDHFDTRATVQLGRSKGKIVVEFASVDDLERIVALMAPHLATRRPADS